MNNKTHTLKSRLANLFRPLAMSAAVIMSSLPQTSLAFSGIANINGWSAEQLKDAGITIRSWTHDEKSKLRDFPAMKWVEITYDWKRMNPDRHVEMTFYSANDEDKLMAACRSEHRKGQTDAMKLVFTVPEENIQNCHVWILFPESTVGGENRIFGLGDGPQGYSLDLRRIAQLAGGKPRVIDMKNPQALPPPAAGENADDEAKKAPQTSEAAARVDADLPTADQVTSVSIEFRHPEHKNVEFRGTANDWAKIRAQLLPAEYDPNPSKWITIGTLEILRKDGSTYHIELYHTADGPGAFSAGPIYEDRKYFRGGKTGGLIEALSAAYQKAGQSGGLKSPDGSPAPRKPAGESKSAGTPRPQPKVPDHWKPYGPEQFELNKGLRMYYSNGTIVVDRDEGIKVDGLGGEELYLLKMENAVLSPRIFSGIRTEKQAKEFCELLMHGALVEDAKSYQGLLQVHRAAGYEPLVKDGELAFDRVAKPVEGGFQVEFTALHLPQTMGAQSIVARYKFTVGKDASVKIESTPYLKGVTLNWQTGMLETKAEQEREAKAQARVKKFVSDCLGHCPNKLPIMPKD